MPTANLRVCIFQSNSPCKPCSQEFIKFRKQIQIPGLIEFQVGRIWKRRRNKGGLLKMFSNQSDGSRPGFKLKAIDWVQFYDAIYEWVRRMNGVGNEGSITFSPKPPVELWKHLYEVSSSAIVLACKESCKVQDEIDELFPNENYEASVKVVPQSQ